MRRTAAIACLLLACARAELVSVYFASRHGTRAPNPVVETVCPGLRGLLRAFDRMGVAPAGVTGNGLREMYSVGAFARRRYVEEAGLLSRNWDPRQVFFNAADEPRTLQSASAMGQGMFRGPRGYSSMPEPVPVSLNGTKGHDNLGEARKAGCASRLARDTALWDAGPGRAFWSERKGLLDRLSAMCGSDLRRALEVSGGVEGQNDAVKDVSDAMMFSIREGLRVPFTEDFYGAVRAAALEQLYGRLISTDAQRVYMAGDFPQAMLAHFKTSVARTNNATSAQDGLKMFGYHGHRELLYALAAFYDVKYNFNGLGFTPGGIPSATTLFFELHRIRSASWNPQGSPGDPPLAPGLYVRLVVYSPCDAVTRVDSGPLDGEVCPGQAYRFGFWPKSDYCPLSEFEKHVQKRVALTGSWRQLCSAPAPRVATASTSASQAAPYASLALVVVVGAAVAYWVTSRKGAETMLACCRRAGYASV